MKLSSVILPMFVVVVIVVARKADHRVALEKENLFQESSQTVPRTLPTVVSPATVLGVVERGDQRYLVGENGPIAVPKGIDPVAIFSFVRLGADVEIDSAPDTFTLGLVDDPSDPTRRLVVVPPDRNPAGT